jgi:tetratricopeptide (TPR) repeat protein
MHDDSSTGSPRLGGWVALVGLGALLMVFKPSRALESHEWRWVLGIFGVVVLWRTWGLLRSSSTSPGRILIWLVIGGMVGSVAWMGVPGDWIRVPAWHDVRSVAMPLLVGAAGLMVVLAGLAGLNRHREMKGAPQRSYLPIFLALVITTSVWHVVRQPLWKESLQGMMRLPQLHSNRMALEASMAPWVDMIQNGSQTPRTGASAPIMPDFIPATTEPPGTFETNHSLTAIDTAGPTSPAVQMPADAGNADHWILTAIHNPSDPLPELKACMALAAEGRQGQALARLDAARDRGCRSPDLIRFHAGLLKKAGRLAASASVLESLVVSQGTDLDLHQCLGAWEQAGQPDRAENLAERMLVKRPSRDVFRWLATRDAARERYERALLLLGQLSRRTPFDPTDAYQLAEVALRAGRPQLALDAVTLLDQHGHRSARTTQLAARARAAAGNSTRPPAGPVPAATGY